MKRTASALALVFATSFGVAACSSSATTADESVVPAEAGDSGTAAEPAASSSFVVPKGAVPIKFFMAKGTNPLLEETAVPLKDATDTVSMHVTNISYAGVVCGFSFTGTERPTPPVQFTMEIEQADGVIVSAVVPVDWEGDLEKGSGSASADGWNFLSGTGPNRNGPGWMVQVGGIPSGGGKSAKAPKQAACSLKSPKLMSPSVGPVSYWAGFATQ
jgi:hypothetical protein